MLGSDSARATALALLVLAAASSPAIGQVPDEQPWPGEAVATLRSFFERVDVEAVLEGVRAPDTSPPETLASVLARLPDGDRAPFGFVQGGVAYRPYPGTLLGAAGTLRARSGNALDQALLLRAMYEQRGRRTRLVRGRLRWSDAVALLGEEPEDLSPGDPWLRRVELVSDHWWLELADGGDWLALDPSFPDADWGAPVGRAVSRHEAPPEALTAMAEIEITGAAGPVGRLALPVPGLLSESFEIVPWRRPPEPESEREGGLQAAALDGEAETEPDALDRFLEERARPVDGLLLVAGDRRRELPAVGPLRLRIEIRRPFAEPETLELRFDPAAGESLSVIFQAGHTGGDRGRAVGPLVATLRSLARAEMEALRAWRERPRPEEESEESADRLAGLAARPIEPELPPRSDDERTEMHPARALHLAALEAWQAFGRDAPPAIGLTALAALDELYDRARGGAPSVRVAAVRWRPPSATGAGGLSLWIRDPAGLGSLASFHEPGVRAAGGFLHSAMLGQVLHSVADAAPATAFDLTLRSVGTGQRLSWWEGPEALPEAWPAIAREMAARDAELGRLLVGPPEAPGRGERAGGGWWAVDAASGTTDGRVVDPDEVTQATVALAAEIDRSDLDAVLASLPTLQRALRWLASAADSRQGVLEGLVPRACAATALVGDLLLAGAPADFPVPRFAAFCAPPPTQSGSVSAIAR